MRSDYGLDTPRDAIHWSALAACRDYDPETWSLKPNVRDDVYRTAHAICDGCPVRASCYEHGVATNAVGVILGGVDFSEHGWKRGRLADEDKTVAAVCPQCRALFAQRRTNQRHCSRRCTDVATSRRHYQRHGRRSA